MRIIIGIFCLIYALFGSSQSVDFPLHHDAYYFLDKWQVQQQANFGSSAKPYSRKFASESMLKKYDSLNTDFRQQYIFIDSRTFLPNDDFALSAKPLWKNQYRYKNDWISYRDAQLDLHVNPVWELRAGRETEINDLRFVNSRGFEIHGSIDQKIGFYTYMTENQQNLGSYINAVSDSMGLVPFEGFWKKTSAGNQDFLRAVGYVDVNLTKSVQAQFGFGRHFWGHGQRSMILSDFANSYPYLRLQANFWKIKYTALHAQLITDVDTYAGGNLGNRTYPMKRMTAHHLELQLAPNFSISVFESIIYGKPDSLGGSNIKPAYLVPFLFYRPVEQQDGSADNALLGIEAKWLLWKKLKLYGQFVLDELIVSELTAGNGWWGNKYAIQFGAHAYDLGIHNLDLWIEHNQARPFTYAHDNLYTAYTHYRQPLAHPFGANFSEILSGVRYQPTIRWMWNTTMMHAVYGDDVLPGVSMGRDPLKSYNLRQGEYNHRIAQGNRNELLLVQNRITYQLFHNFNIEASTIWRAQKSQLQADTSYWIFMAGIRWNVPFRPYWF